LFKGYGGCCPIEPHAFFYITLKQRNPEDISKLFAKYEAEITGLVKEIISLVYYMRGAIQYDDMMNRSRAERRLIGDFITERLEAESKRPNPIY